MFKINTFGDKRLIAFGFLEIAKLNKQNCWLLLF
jgi:hypothetical protein